MLEDYTFLKLKSECKFIIKSLIILNDLKERGSAGAMPEWRGEKGIRRS